MKQILPNLPNGAKILTAPELNALRFSDKRTVLTPGLLKNKKERNPIVALHVPEK